MYAHNQNLTTLIVLQVQSTPHKTHTPCMWCKTLDSNHVAYFNKIAAIKWVFGMPIEIASHITCSRSSGYVTTHARVTH
jgi:hypothetical protein